MKRNDTRGSGAAGVLRCSYVCTNRMKAFFSLAGEVAGRGILKPFSPITRGSFRECYDERRE